LAKIQSRLQETPESSLEDSLYVLNTILDYASGVQRDPKQFSMDKLEEYNQKIDIINANIDRFKDLTLQTDVSFPPGRYKLEDLSPAGQAACEQLVEKVAATVQDLQRQYTNYPLRVTIKTIGYTDETPFVTGTSLIREMEAEISNLAPEGAARRTQYNQVLSQFRAKSLNHYFTTQLKQRLSNTENIDILPKIVGLGETLPNTQITPAYTERDERRRISIVSPFIEVML
jgi:outer membrane protein OmpA-like peptidoglycan-associated protein